jgi:hypothetical protein
MVLPSNRVRPYPLYRQLLLSVVEEALEGQDQGSNFSNQKSVSALRSGTRGQRYSVLISVFLSKCLPAIKVTNVGSVE